MIKFIDVTGKTEDEAIQSALAQLKMDRDDVSVEILERAKAGFLGIGSAPARVRVSYDDGKAEEVKPVEKPAAPKPEKKVEPASAPKAVPMYAPEVLQKKEPRAAKEERSGRPAREDRRAREKKQQICECALHKTFQTASAAIDVLESEYWAKIPAPCPRDTRIPKADAL